jgi:mono/diheme cytochrome c family protein
MRSLTVVVFGLCAALAAVPALADAPDGAQVFASKCSSCHGSKGQGTTGLAPALKGDAFVISGKLEDLQATIQNGRSGDQKHFKDIPMAMPGWHLSPAELQALVDYLRGGLQKP